jgi:DNA-binding response OmpR family regulator
VADVRSRVAVVVEDDPETRSFVARALQEEGLEVRTAGRAESARSLVREGDVDLVVLDVGLPGASGFELCAEIRREGSGVPILMLTAHSDVGSRVEGLETGADDYLGKPFALAELKARVRALLRRTRPGTAESVLEHAGVRVDLRRRRAFRGNEEIPLTRRELDLLARLVRARGVVVPREVLLEDLWGQDTPEAAASLEVIVSRLRRKLPRGAEGTSLVRNVRGVGYSIDEGNG